MKSISFTIDRKEVRSLSDKTLNDKEISSILEIVENDGVLWNDIEESIEDAIGYIKSPKWMRAVKAKIK